MSKQEELNSNTVQADPILRELVTIVKRNRDAVTALVMNNGLADEATYRYAVGKYWALEFVLDNIAELVKKYHKQEDEE